MSGRMQSTYSMWSKFRNCRKACEWRYLRHLVPVERDHNLAFGAVIHDCLELWHRHGDLDRVPLDTGAWNRHASLESCGSFLLRFGTRGLRNDHPAPSGHPSRGGE